MQWIAPSEKDAATDTLEKRLWDSADQFRENSGPKAQKYSGPILGIVFLRFAEIRFAAHRLRSRNRRHHLRHLRADDLLLPGLLSGQIHLKTS